MRESWTLTSEGWLTRCEDFGSVLTTVPTRVRQVLQSRQRQMRQLGHNQMYNPVRPLRRAQADAQSPTFPPPLHKNAVRNKG